MRHLCVGVSWAKRSIHGGKDMSEEQMDLGLNSPEPTAAQKLQTIRTCIRLAKVRPQFIILSKATANELSNIGGLKPIYAWDDQIEETPIGYRIDDDGPIIIEDDRMTTFLLVAEVPLRQAGLSALPESAIIKPRF